MTFESPIPAPTPDERELLLRFLQRQRAEVIAASSLTNPCLGREGTAPPAHILLGMAEPLDLRWAVLHLIEETAHHAGHADATRELLDGRKTGA